MDFPSVAIAKYITAGLGACVLATEIPLPEPMGAFASFGVVGLSLFLLWWVLARLIPGMTEAHAKQLQQLGESHAAAVKTLTDFVRDLEAKQASK